MRKKYPVVLSAAERTELIRLIAAGTESARKLTHARILLKADQGEQGPAWVDESMSGSPRRSRSASRRWPVSAANMWRRA